MKHDLFRSYRRGCIEFHEYKDFNNKFTYILKKVKIDYFKYRFEKYRTDMKKTWDTVRNLAGCFKSGVGIEKFYMKIECIKEI